MKRTHVILYSSGIDSYLLRKYLELTIPKENIKLVYYDINCRYSAPEIDMLVIQKEKEGLNNLIIDKTFNFENIEEQSSFIPNRNLQLAMHATKYGDNIYIGGTMSDRVSDNNKDIIEKLSDIVSQSLNRKIIITSPFWNYYKCEIANWYTSKNSIEDIQSLIGNTFSCYKPKCNKQICKYYLSKNKELFYDTFECMYCKACFRKSVIMFSMNYFRKFYNNEIINYYKQDCLNAIKLNPRQEWTMKYIDETER